MLEDQNNRKCEIAKSENMAEAKRERMSEVRKIPHFVVRYSAFNYLK